jgi:hypothetical protein
MHALVMAGAKPVACFADQDEAEAFKTFLVTAGVTAAVTVNAVIAGLPGDHAGTCDDYLKGADAIVSEVVTILNA